MRTTLSLTTVLIASAAMISACATPGPLSVEPPRLSIPTAATKTCLLDVLPANPTEADLEAAYVARGAAVLNCDGARQLALETLLTERRLIDQWLALQRPEPWYKRLWPG